jgi:ubiquinone/menaquinone biosynthesis C-methylase UbiE
MVLHAGCGGDTLPAWFKAEEVRLDCDARHDPDIVASMTDIPCASESFDAVFCQHALEHLPDAVKALREFRRVLKPGGYVLATVPDLEDVQPTEEVIYVTEGGLHITGKDMHYGLQSVLDVQPAMAHHTQFVRESFEAAFREAGFERVKVDRASSWNLIGVAVK